MRSIERDASGVVDSGLTLERRVGSSFDLPPSKDGEDDRRILL
jgi:hypothetical protein